MTLNVKKDNFVDNVFLQKKIKCDCKKTLNPLFTIRAANVIRSTKRCNHSRIESKLIFILSLKLSWLCFEGQSILKVKSDPSSAI